mmetsp:Transcript_20843/g.43574  ORF Transcript_20843/g.43574 Transcript_20843/m.43574 type:complete len:382 (-) Transcript_20843:113-1258(-)
MIHSNNSLYEDEQDGDQQYDPSSPTTSSSFLPVSLDKALKEIQIGKGSSNKNQHGSPSNPQQAPHLPTDHDEEPSESSDAYSLDLSEMILGDDMVSELTHPSGGSGLFTPYTTAGGLFDYSANGGSQIKLQTLYQDDEGEDDEEASHAGSKPDQINADLLFDDDQEESIGFDSDLFLSESSNTNNAMRQRDLYADDDDDETTIKVASPRRSKANRSLSLPMVALITSSPPALPIPCSTLYQDDSETDEDGNDGDIYQEGHQQEHSETREHHHSPCAQDDHGSISSSTCSTSSILLDSNSMHALIMKGSLATVRRTSLNATATLPASQYSSSAADDFVDQIIDKKIRVRAERQKLEAAAARKQARAARSDPSSIIPKHVVEL